MATKKTTKKPAKAKTPKGRSAAMSTSHERHYDDPEEKADEGLDEELEEHPDAGTPYVDNPAFPPMHVSPQGSGAPSGPALKSRLSAHLSQEQQFTLLIAAILHSGAGPHTIQQSYQNAKNLMQTLLDDEAENEPEPEDEGEAASQPPN